ncbi:MAG: hypothetical protein EXR67_02775 [Dehalococcoidia bacterium]|nr:hypothetical protein [Dehalococcoidia bacterium]
MAIPAGRPSEQRSTHILSAEDRARSELGTYFTRGLRFSMLRDAIEQLHPANLLVVRCNVGYLESMLSEDIRILSTDVHEDTLDAARRVNAHRRNRAFVMADVYHLMAAAKPGQFQAAVVCVAEHVADDVGALKVVGECLAPGGTMFLVVTNAHRFQNTLHRMIGRRLPVLSSYHLREYTKESAETAVRKAGLRVEQIVGLDFTFPKEGLVERVVPFGSGPRQWLAARFPGAAT